MAFTPLVAYGYEAGGGKLIPSGDKFGGNSGNAHVTGTNPYTGSYCARLGDDAGWRVDIPGQRDEIYISFFMQPKESYSFSYNKGPFVRINLENGGDFEFYYDIDNNTFDMTDGDGQSGTEAFDTGNYNHIQIHFILGAAGLVHTKINGVTDILYYGDTRSSGDTYVTQLEFYVDGPNNSQSLYSYIDDLVIGYGGWPGALRAQKEVPDGDKATDDFEKSSGTENYSLIDEVGPSTSDYIYADADGEQAIVSLSDFGVSGVTPAFVGLWAYAQKTTGNDDRLAFISQLAGANKQVHSQQSLLNASWSYISEILANAPDGTPWTDAHVDDLEIGFDAEIV